MCLIINIILFLIVSSYDNTGFLKSVIQLTLVKEFYPDAIVMTCIYMFHLLVHMSLDVFAVK